MSTQIGQPLARPSDRVFFTGMALAAAMVVFAGFSPTYYLRSPEMPALSPLLRLHGFVFTCWVGLFLMQVGLISAGRAAIHRRLGIVAALLAAVMVVLGVIVSIDSFRRGVTGPGLDPHVLLSIPLGTILVFVALVTLGIAFRRDPAAHKRYMLLATIDLLGPAIGRILLLFDGPVLLLFVFTNLFVAAVALHDLFSRGRVHPASISGGSLVVLFKPVLVLAATTPAWFAFSELLR